jgi:hypothetical protein
LDCGGRGVRITNAERLAVLVSEVQV